MAWAVLPGVYPVWDSLGFLDLGGYFLPHFRGFFNCYLLTYFSWPFFLTYSSGTPMIQMFGHLTLSQRSLRLSSFPSILFFFPLCLINDDQTQRANIKSSKCKAAKTHEGIPIKITADLSIETLQARRKWQDIVKVMKEKNLQPRLL